MAYSRFAIPMCIIGITALSGCGFASKASVTVYADTESDVTVEILDAKHTVEATVDLHPGERATLEATKGKHTIVSTKRDGKKHEVALNLERRKHYAVPTSPDQCFALLNIGPWYSSKVRNVDLTDARVEQRMSKSMPYGFPKDTYGIVEETPEEIEYTQRPKLVTAFPCAKMAAAADSDILATLDGPVGTTTLTSDSKTAFRPRVPSGPKQFQRLMAEKKDWTRIYEDEFDLAYRNKNGEFLVVALATIPNEDDVAENPRAMSELMTKLDKSDVLGIYHRDDLLPSLLLTPPPSTPSVTVGAAHAGLIFRHASDNHDEIAQPALVAAIGGDLPKLATENAKTRFAEAATKCLEKIPAKPTFCTNDHAEGTGILLLTKDAPKLKGKVWFRLDGEGLQVAKASKKIPTAGFGDQEDSPMLFTLQKNELKLGLE